MYLKLENGDITFPYTLENLKRDNPNVSFPKNITSSVLESFGVYEVREQVPDYNSNLESLSIQEPRLEGGFWKVSYDKIPLTEEEIVFKAETQAAQIRQQRNELLRQSDWYVTRQVETGIPIPAEWAEYRSYLRDISKLSTFPYVDLRYPPGHKNFISREDIEKEVDTWRSLEMSNIEKSRTKEGYEESSEVTEYYNNLKDWPTSSDYPFVKPVMILT